MASGNGLAVGGKPERGGSGESESVARCLPVRPLDFVGVESMSSSGRKKEKVEGRCLGRVSRMT